MVRKVLKISNKKLRNVSKSVPSNGKITKVLQDMKDTMNSLGGIGIAAPQINVFYRIILIAPPKRKPFFMINPEIIDFSEEKTIFQEACLSVPNKHGDVERSYQITVRYEDEKRVKHTAVAYDFEATIIQHEIDHLNGILFVDHLA